MPCRTGHRAQANPPPAGPNSPATPRNRASSKIHPRNPQPGGCTRRVQHRPAGREPRSYLRTGQGRAIGPARSCVTPRRSSHYGPPATRACLPGLREALPAATVPRPVPDAGRIRPAGSETADLPDEVNPERGATFRGATRPATCSHPQWCRTPGPGGTPSPPSDGCGAKQPASTTQAIGARMSSDPRVVRRPRARDGHGTTATRTC